MKKGFVLFLSIIFVAFTGFMPVKADNDITIGGSSYIDDYITNDQYKHINYSGLLMEYLRQGGTLDISNIDTDSEDLALDVINTFGDFAVDVLRETGNFIDWIGNGQVFQEELIVNRDPVAWKPALKNNIWQLLGQLPFMSLNTDEGNEPIPEPDINYIDYINYINGNGFFWKNWIQTTLYPQYTNVNLSLIPFQNYSYLWFNGYSSPANSSNNNASTEWGTCIADGIEGVYIIGSDNQWNYSYSAYCPYNYTYFGNQFNSVQFRYVGGSEYIQAGWSNSAGNHSYTSSTFSSLQALFEDLIHRVKNVNIYVNGQLWSYVGGNTDSYSIQLGTGTVVPTTNGRVEWKYDDEIYIDIDLIWQLLDRFINDPNRNTNIIDFGVIEDCIVDANGQTAIAVKVIQDDPLSIDDQLVLDYGTLIPIFPVAVDYPIDVRDTARIAVIGVQVIPSDIIEIVILGIFGMLFVCFVHRGLE